MDRFDDYFFMIAKEAGGIEGLLTSFFSFLQRRTDFYYECDPGDKMGFPPGVAMKMVLSRFQNFQQEHYKKHPPKTPQEYQEKLKAKQQQAAQQQQTQSQQQPQQPVQKQQPVKKEADVGFNTYNGGETEKYKWSQSGQDVTVGIEVAPGTTKKDVKILMTNTILKVEYKGEVIVNGELYDRIKQDDSIWSIEDGKKIILTLEKASENIWKTVIKGDVEIDATKVENSKPLEDFDPETQGALRKIMYEQQRKNMGLPTTDEEKQLDVLQKAWNAEGSPFKGTPFDPHMFNLQQNSFNV